MCDFKMAGQLSIVRSPLKCLFRNILTTVQAHNLLYKKVKVQDIDLQTSKATLYKHLFPQYFFQNQENFQKSLAYKILQECNVTIYSNIESMKFERPKGNQVLNNKVQINNQQFLTFRNAQPNQNTGRSVYSQQFDYRSLQKCFKEQQQDVPVYNFRKNFKNIRSQDKYKQIKQQARITLLPNENGENNKEQHQQKNEQLNKKLEQLIKNIRKAKKKESYLQQQIENIDSVVKLNSKDIQKHKADIQQLEEILEENQTSHENMLFKLEQYNQKAYTLSKKLEYAEEELQKEHDSTQSSGQSGPQLTKKLQLGIKQLQKMRDQYQTKIESFLSEINHLEQKLANLQLVNNQIRSII